MKPVEVTEIRIRQYPTKLEYFAGDYFDLSGFAANILYNNGDLLLIDDTNGGPVGWLEYVYGDGGLIYENDSEVLMEYRDIYGNKKPVNFSIDRIPVESTGIFLNAESVKTTYFVGDTFDASGLKVWLTKNNGKNEEITDYTIVETGPLTENMTSVTVEYEGYTASIRINVVPVQVTRLEIEQAPSKTEYSAGEAFDSAGMVVRAYYNNGTSEVITDFTVTPEILSENDSAVTIHYGGQSVNQAVSVAAAPIPEDAPQIVVNSVKTTAGSTVEVKIELQNNPGILGAVLGIAYDEGLELVSAEKGVALASLDFTKPGSFESPCNFTWDALEGQDTTDGVVLVLTFRVLENAMDGDKYNIYVTWVSGVDEDLNPVDMATMNGEISIISYIPGDVNGDETIDIADVILIRRYITGGYGVEVPENAADVNKDGVVDIADVILIRRYITGGYGVVLK